MKLSPRLSLRQLGVVNDMTKALFTCKTITNTKNEMESLLAPNVSANVKLNVWYHQSYKIIYNRINTWCYQGGLKVGR
jgi:hypothetical protein